MPSYVLAACIMALHANSMYTTENCVYPEICKPPSSKFAKVLPIRPRMQWNINGGFCGSLSVQVMGMSYGAWLSQDVIRKANRGGPCYGHTSQGNGCEVGPENYGVTARGLRLDYDEWDYSRPTPQAHAFKQWMKSHLVKGQPVMWVPMEKGNSHTPYGPQSCPGGGHFDHHEPVIGIGSHHDLSDTTVYDDDWMVHFSDYDLQPCYRRFVTLEDNVSMEGNCKRARKDLRQMFPCFNENVTYGLAIKGFSVKAPTLRVFLDVDQPSEPDVRLSEPSVGLLGTIRVQGLEPGRRYVLYRYNSTEALPYSQFDIGYEYKTPFFADSYTWTFEDPHPFPSSGATYYIAVPEIDPEADDQVEHSGIITGVAAPEQTAVSFWLSEAPTWPNVIRTAMRGFASSPKYQGGGQSEALAAQAVELYQRVSLFPHVPVVVCALALAAAMFVRLRRQRAQVVVLERPALG